MLASFLIDKMVLISMQKIVVVQLTKLMMKLGLNFEDGLSKCIEQGDSRIITNCISEEDLIFIKMNKQPSDVLVCRAVDTLLQYHQKTLLV